MVDYNIPIPRLSFPNAKVQLKQEEEPLVDVGNYKKSLFCIDMQYKKQNIPGAISKCYLRKSAFEQLLIAESFLPLGYKLKIYDAWRPLAVQRSLYQKHYNKVVNQGDFLDISEIEKKVATYVSYPSEDILSPPVHCTGGSIDLTLVNRFGKELNMGTLFDEFIEASHTAYFEGSNNTEVVNNRRLLYNVMIEADFSNLSSEWWHYDYGTIFWGYYYNKPAKYCGIFKIDD